MDAIIQTESQIQTAECVGCGYCCMKAPCAASSRLYPGVTHCPQLVWSGAEKNRRRYEVEWNPFDVKVLYMGEEFGGWQPEPDTVFSKLQEML